MNTTNFPVDDEIIREDLFVAVRQGSAQLSADLIALLHTDSCPQAVEILQLGVTPGFLAQVLNFLRRINAARNAHQ